AQLQHPAIVPIYEAGAWPDGSAFYTMRLVSGGTLADAIAETTTLAERLALLPHVNALTEALAYAHSRRIVHRDLKPGNVLVGEFGETVVIDWGLAKELDKKIDDSGISDHAPRGSDITYAGAVLGTPGFMSPEQAIGAEIDERTDVYALGAILYSVLAGQPPATPRAALSPDVPVDLRAIVERAMAPASTDRFATAKDMAEELRRFEAGQLLRSREYTPRELVARWVRRHRAGVTIGAIALAIVATVGIGALINVTRSRTAERAARQTAEQALRTADADVASLLAEQGRVLLLSGDRERALVYLDAAFQRADTVALRHLLAAATRDFELLEHTVRDPTGGITSLGFEPDGKLVTVGASITTWDGDRAITSHPLADTDRRDSWLDRELSRAAVIDTDGAFTMYEVATGATLWAAAMIPETRVTFAGSQVVLVNERGGEMRDVDRGTLTAKFTATVAASSPDGQWVAVAHRDGSLSVWATGARRRVATLPIAQELTALAFLGAGRIVTGSADGRAEIWTIDRSAPVVPLTRGVGIRSLAVSARGDLIATGDAVGAVRLWTVGGQLVGEARDQQGEVAELAFSPNGTLLLGAGLDKRVYVWDTDALELVRAVTGFIGGEILRVTDHGLAWAPDGMHFATVRHRDDVSVWRTPAGRRIARRASQASAVGRTSMVLVDRGKASLVQLATGARLKELSVPTGPMIVQLSHDGDRALVWHDLWRRAAIYDLTAGTELAKLALFHPTLGTTNTEPTSYMALGPTLSADGRFVLEVPLDRGPLPARVYDATTGRLIRELADPELANAAISPSGDRVVLVGHKRATMWRVATGEQLGFAPNADDLYSSEAAVFDRSGRRLLFYGMPVPVVVDADSGKTIAKLDPVGPTGVVYHGSLDDDGDRAVTWAYDRSVRLWNVATGVSIVTVEAVPQGSAAVSGDGQRFATGADDGTVRIWDGTTGRLLEVIPRKAGPVSLAWSADSTRLVAQSLSATWIWDVHTDQRSPREIHELTQRVAPWQLSGGLLVPRP
ncbi:MAG TPA: serine/threonine-protein kinase, partial [Kofleriaceae bacterium]